MDERYHRFVEFGDEFIPARSRARHGLSDARRIDHAPGLAQDGALPQDQVQAEVIGDVHPAIHELPEDPVAGDRLVGDRGLENELEREIDHDTDDGLEEIADYLRNVILNDEEEPLDLRRARPRKLDEFIESGILSGPIEIAVDKSRGEVLLMMLKFSIANQLPFNGIVNLFKLTNCIFSGPILPDTKYSINQMLDTGEEYEFHAVCHECNNYLGKFGEIPAGTNTCPACHESVDVSSPSKSSFFLIIDCSRQLSELLYIYGDHWHYVVNERVHVPGILSDVYDGSEMIDFVNNLPAEVKRNYICGSLCADGAQKFDSSQSSAWPIYYQIDQLPKQARMKHQVLCGLYHHKKKPDLTVLFDPFVDRMNRLSETGFPCVIRGEQRNIKPYINKGCFDAAARAPAQGVHQWNGYCGCNWCVHPGEMHEGSMRYSYLNNPVLRNEESFRRDVLRATPQVPINGIIYPSPLLRLERFKMVDGFITEYMHFALEGNGKDVAEIYFSRMSPAEIDELDQIMTKIAVPCQLSRLTRKISERKLWKAKEWENFILYYSIPIFSQKLNRHEFEHWLLFVDSLYTLLQDEIRVQEVNRANVMLHSFVEGAEELFGLAAMKYNMHLSLHVCRNVLNWGPLWAVSQFGPETYNRYILSAIKSANGVPQQVARSVTLRHTVTKLEEHVYREADPLVKFFCIDVLSNKSKNILKVLDLTYLGLPKPFLPSHGTEHLGLSPSTVIYTRLIKDGCLYSSHNNIRSDDKYALLRDKRMIKIVGFIVDEANRLQFTLCKRVITRPAFQGLYTKMQLVSRVANETIVVDSDEIERICVHMEAYGNEYICPVPNLLHY